LHPDLGRILSMTSTAGDAVEHGPFAILPLS